MTKSFKENYADMNTPTVEVDEITVAPVIIAPFETKLPKTSTKTPMPEIKEPKAAPIELTEEIANVLTEQREQSAKVLESVMKTNTKIANGVAKLVKNTIETNDKLVEAIVSLTDKIELLETKLDAIKNLEIPTPIVHVQAPRTKILKEIKRDKNNLMTHIEEIEVPIDEDE